MATVTEPTVQAFLQRRSEASASGLIPLAAIQGVTGLLREIANEIEVLTGDWNPVNLYTPTEECRNREEERFNEAFDKGEIYNPKFTYAQADAIDPAPVRAKLIALANKLRACLPFKKLAEEWLATILSEKIVDELAVCDLIDGLAGRSYQGLTGDALTKRAFHRMYWQLDDELLARAEAAYRQLIVTKPTPQGGCLDNALKTAFENRQCEPQEMADAFAWALKRLGIFHSEGNPTGFKVVISDGVTAIDVRQRSEGGPTVFIPANKKDADTYKDLLYLVDHEIGGHARQSENGYRLFGMCGGRMAPPDETLYEGLAMRKECDFLHRQYGEESAFLFKYPTAVARAQQGGSFHDVFCDQYERWLHVELSLPVTEVLPSRNALGELHQKAKKAAYRTTYRVMRGHRDTANKEAFSMPKDLAYDRGLLIQREMDAQGLGYVNEMGIFTREAFLMMAEIDFGPNDLPLQDLHLADQYLPILQAKMSTK